MPSIARAVTIAVVGSALLPGVMRCASADEPAAPSARIAESASTNPAVVAPRSPTARRKAAEEHYRAGERAFTGDDFPTAERELQQSLELRPCAKVALLLGRAQVKQARYDEARASWRMALKLDRRSSWQAEVTRSLKTIEGMASARMRIDSFPEGATVYLDMKASGPRGKTPLELAMMPGRHRVIVEKDGYDESIAVPDPVAIAGSSIPVMVTLPQKGCNAVLRGKPLGVQASIDGGTVVALPATLRLSPGVHEITFSGRLLAPQLVPLECRDLKPLAVERTLERLPDGILVIHAKRNWQIFVDRDDVPVERATQWRVAPGVHSVEVREAGKTPWHAEVNVGAGQELDVRPQPEAGQKGLTGIQIEVTPPDAVCYLDGKLQPAGLHDAVAVRSGRHEVEVLARGHHPLRRTVDVADGDIAYIDARPVQRSWWPLWIGLGSLGVVAVAEAVAIPYHLKITPMLGDDHRSTEVRRWQLYESIGHSVAGASLAAATGLLIYQFAHQTRTGLRPTGSAAGVRLGAAITPGGGNLAVSGAF